MLHAPRAIAKVRCWNPDRLDEPVFYGNKLAFTCVHVDEILPYPTTWVMGEAEKQRQDDKSNNAGSPSIARYSPSVYSPSARTKTDSPSAELSSPGSVCSPGSARRMRARKESASPGSASPSPSGKDAARLERQHDSLLRAQAETVRLEEEVRAMERRLERTRFGAGAD